MEDKTNPADSQALTVLLQLEADARQAEDLLALQYFIVNETRRLVTYRHAVLLSASNHRGASFRVTRASGLTHTDRAAPKMQWLEQVVSALQTKSSSPQPAKVDFTQLSNELQQDRRTFSLAYPIWVPLLLPNRSYIGGLWLEKEQPWKDDEVFLLQRLAATYAHAWGYFYKRRRWNALFEPSKTWWAAAGLLLTLSFLPVQQSTLAPVKIIAKDPLLISAPIDGVIAVIPVEPNRAVAQGTALLSYEDTHYRNEHTVAEQSLAVALAELKKARQGAFLDTKSKAEVALLQAKVDLTKSERDYAKEKLDRVTLLAERDGLLLFKDKSELIGRPVNTGERLMEIADPEQLKLRIDLPVANTIEFDPGSEVKVFLDVDPLNSVSAKVSHANFRAEVMPGDLLAYPVEAEITDKTNDLRIGWQGTAKIYGQSVSLFFYLFRRPLSVARQFLGW